MKKAAAQRKTAPRSPASGRKRLRILTVVPICDGHDSAIVSINAELVKRGIEVVYLGYHRSVRDIVRAAIQEDVQAVGISSYNGGHVEFFTEVVAALEREGAKSIRVFGGGGGTITKVDARTMQRKGVDRIFFPGTGLSEIAEWVATTYGPAAKKSKSLPGFPGRFVSDLGLARALTAADQEPDPPRFYFRDHGPCPAIGIAGPGGAGKTTLIDELVLRFLRNRPGGRLAILSHDPSLADGGALLGDRACLVYAHDDRVFLRSLATRQMSGGLSKATRPCLGLLRRAGFDLVLVETTGIGQESRPFARGLLDLQILVLSPGYGSRLQLHKIAMLDIAELVVLNKADLPGARTAVVEIEQRLSVNNRRQDFVATVAKRHRDPGVDSLFERLQPSMER
jgi:methylmalonyl-CoA mutase cobalamin-binding domain/chain